MIDDSAPCQFMTEVVASQVSMQLSGRRRDLVAALPKLQQNWPDVIVLDVEMPSDGWYHLFAAANGYTPNPVVICSSLTGAGAALTLDALAAGAVAVFAKAKLGVRAAFGNYRE